MARRLPTWLLGLSFVAALGATRTALADSVLGAGGVATAPPASSGTDQATVARYWELGRPRSFLSGTVEAGFVYLRLRLAAGYGKPYWRWFGAEAYPLLSLRSLGQYLGIGAALPGFTLRGGLRYEYPFSQTFLPPQAHYGWQDISLRGPDKADYLAYEAEATATIPSVLGSTFFVLTGEHIELAPEGYNLYENGLHVVVSPPWVWRGRIGQLVGFGRNEAIRVGVAADLIGLPGRNAIVLRAGVLASVQLTSQLHAEASLIPVIVSPDELGLAGGDFGQLGIRYRFATGSKPAAAPGPPGSN